ncbi:MAG: acetyl-CoA carboxylase carboxyl transferase subunit beta [Candidatus Omnitrophica bacterium CG_4_10_14_0_2_um_filter_44_9]|nr:MAG: acetyl-CoA carboxylase carboxyl transferase subunit beta [Candidatus Omnitrophica bacterium CG_4_10_14_0_8_um_filter_44_12]PIZ83419.1 MAG: acetyl-CoA carboxylase carboxyl transferase subunit beta [Candidatus Omnitrophica bacterium CG_4_10_14_0_2_um_filter_44_9]
MPLFGKPKYTIVKIRKREIPEGLWTKCQQCSQPIYKKALEENLRICPKCEYHFTMTATERLEMMLDVDSFKEYDAGLSSGDPLEFKGIKSYKQKLSEDQKITSLKDAVITGEGSIFGKKAVVAITDSRFIMGSMGSVVGEKITRAIEKATEKKLPIVIVSGSGGGARMYEGIYSLMQMAKTSAALGRHHEAGLLFISVLTNPTMGGVLASFAGLGDVIIAEPRALIGFAGPRVIEQTTRQKLPEGFQKSEFMLEHGLLDMIVNRKVLKDTLHRLIDYLS